MTTSMLAFGKASAAGRLRVSKQFTRLSSTAPAAAPASSNGNGAHPKPADAATQRELFMDVLSANATRRDAKQYLARFRPSKSKPASKLSPAQEERNARHRRDQDRLERIGVNLGGLYAPARAIADSPQFTRDSVAKEEKSSDVQEPMHVALVCLREPEELDDGTLDGVALTLSQLVKLDMRIVVVLDCGTREDLNSDPKTCGRSAQDGKGTMAEQGERLCKAISAHSPEAARFVSGAIETQDEHLDGTTDRATVGLPSLLLNPLRRSMVPIIPTLAYTTSGQIIRTPVSSIMLAISSMLCGLPSTNGANLGTQGTPETSLDRIIVLDAAGGIPSKARRGGAHVFINLEQEYNDIQTELAENDHKTAEGGTPLSAYHQHQSNLSMLNQCLSLLPSASSGLIITPQEAASSSRTGPSDDSTIGAGTRRQKNTLIHNLLTNKPVVSSSLPVGRLPKANGDDVSIEMPTATLVKRGMPLTIIPAVDRGAGWQPPANGETSLDLANDPRVDFPRLLHLIEDSFRRRLDVAHYLDRIRGRVAGLIIAGEYEGGAILTWESPPSSTNPRTSGEEKRLVPYLDKFAVLSSSQGSSGVADIVFQAMVRTCFPHGVCWRSRKDNPVSLTVDSHLARTSSGASELLWTHRNLLHLLTPLAGEQMVF